MLFKQKIMIDCYYYFATYVQENTLANCNLVYGLPNTLMFGSRPFLPDVRNKQISSGINTSLHDYDLTSMQY